MLMGPMSIHSRPYDQCHVLQLWRHLWAAMDRRVNLGCSVGYCAHSVPGTYKWLSEQLIQSTGSHIRLLLNDFEVSANSYFRRELLIGFSHWKKFNERYFYWTACEQTRLGWDQIVNIFAIVLFSNIQIHRLTYDRVSWEQSAALFIV